MHGDHRGRELGYPTANLDPLPRSCVPRDGVYAAWWSSTLWPRSPIGPCRDLSRREPDVRRHRAAGRGPHHRAREWDLYGRQVALDFTARIRGMVAFDTADDLLDAMAGDVLAAQRLVGQADA